MANLVQKAVSNIKAKASQLLGNLDRDKSMPGFQLAQGGLMNKIANTQISYDPNSFIGRPIQSMVNFQQRTAPLIQQPQRLLTEGILSSKARAVPTFTSFGEQLGNRQLGEDVGYGVRGALSLTPFQGGNKELEKKTAPTTKRQQTAQSFGKALYGTALTAPLSASDTALKTTLNVGKNVLGGATVGATMRGGSDLLTGNFSKDSLVQGAISGMENAWVLPVTNGITDFALSKIGANKLVGELASDPFKRGQIKEGFKRLFLQSMAQVPAENTAFTFLNQLDDNTKGKFIENWMSNLPGSIVGNMISAGVSGTVSTVFNKESRKVIQDAMKKTIDEWTVPVSMMGGKKMPMWQYKMMYETKPGFIKPSEFVPEGKVEVKTPEQQTNQVFQEVQANKKFMSETPKYIQEQVDKQVKAAGKETLTAKLKALPADIESKFGDFFAPIENTLTKAEKTGNFKVLPTQDVRIQVDKALRADTQATQFIKDNQLDKVIQGVENLDEFNQYLIARHAKDVAANGFETGRNLAKDADLVKYLSPKYEEAAKQVASYNQKLLDYSVEAGLVDPKLAQQLKIKYPDYVPLKRIFDLTENVTPKTGAGGPASLSTQDVLKRLKGSSREIANPLESMVEATGVAFRQGERNKIARMLVSYKQLPGNPFGLKEIKGPAGVKHTVSFLDNGKKRVFETLPEIAEAAKNMDVQAMNIYLQMMRIPTRLLQLGAVGYNVPFVIGNLAKDQITASVLSSKPMATSLANPLNFTRALYSVLKQDKLYDDWVRSGASFTSFDIARDQVAPTVAKIRSQRSVPSSIAYTVRHPGELLRAVENIVGKTEELTRVQNFNGMRDAFIKEGRTFEDATALAADASRNNTANFGRRGAWSTVINSVIPFFNASIQGARSLVKAVKANPVGTATRFATTVGMPVAITTMWNISDPLRKAAYDDIPEYEKEEKLIILPEVPEKGADGRWKAIALPIPPGISNIAALIRKPIEGTQQLNFQGIKDMAANIFTAGTGVNMTSGRHLVSQLTPQAVKPEIEILTNTNLYTGNQIVPFYMKQKPPEEQVYKNTSGTARILGKATGVSPIMVENVVGTAGAGVGKQLLNLSDQLLASQGKIPQEQVGGESIGRNLYKRFQSAAGGQQAKIPGTKDYAIKKYDLPVASMGKGGTPSINAVATTTKPSTGKFETVKQQQEVYSKVNKVMSDPDLSAQDKRDLVSKMGVDPKDAEYYSIASENADARTAYAMDTIDRISSTSKNRNDVLVELGNQRLKVNGKMVLTDPVINNLVDEGYLTYNEGRMLKKLEIGKTPTGKKARVKVSGRGGGAKLKVKLTPISTLLKTTRTKAKRFRISKERAKRIMI